MEFLKGKKENACSTRVQAWRSGVAPELWECATATAGRRTGRLNDCVVSSPTGDLDDAEFGEGEQSEVRSRRLSPVPPRCTKRVLLTVEMFPIQDWPGGDPQEMKLLLEKLARENQQIAQLESQLQVRRSRPLSPPPRFRLLLA